MPFVEAASQFGKSLKEKNQDGAGCPDFGGCSPFTRAYIEEKRVILDFGQRAMQDSLKVMKVELMSMYSDEPSLPANTESATISPAPHTGQGSSFCSGVNKFCNEQREHIVRK